MYHNIIMKSIISFITLICILIIIFIKIGKKEVKYVKSDLDGERYIVRDLKDKQKAANMLAKIKKNIMSLVNHLNSKKYTEYEEFREYIDQLNDKIQYVEISESSEDSVYTSYSVNKGEQIVFCLRSKKNKNLLHSLNLVMYVAIHEISHVACPEYGHTDLFKKIFAFFTHVAIKQGIYKKIYFKEDPIEYCGLMISESII